MATMIKRVSLRFLVWTLVVVFNHRGATGFIPSFRSVRNARNSFQQQPPLFLTFSKACTGAQRHNSNNNGKKEALARLRLSLHNDNHSETTTTNNNGNANRPHLPSLVIFDLDGCLWRPEMYELLYFSGGAGAPFTKSPDYESDGTLLTRAGEPVRLLGDIRQIMQELHCDPQWQQSTTKVGISSRTDQPDWARELLQKFTIRKDATNSNSNSNSKEDDETFCLQDVFQGPIEIRSDSKVQHFERISAQTGVPFHEMLFFDNERGNCREVAQLGVVVGYCPDGVSKRLWDVSLEVFSSASGKVIGLDIYGYDTLEGANKLFYDSEDYKRTKWE